VRIYFGIVGILCLAVGAILAFRRMRALLFGASAIGTVVRVEVRESDDSSSHVPVISYVDTIGRQHTFTSTSGVAVNELTPGEKMSIRYSISNPESAYINSLRHMWGAPIALLVLGIAGVWASMAQ
jgi:hypothetical protein